MVEGDKGKPIHPMNYKGIPVSRWVDGVLEENMAITVEAFVGSEHGGEGVKLEEMVVIKDGGYQLPTTFPFGERTKKPGSMNSNLFRS